ncbi:unnamed protein product [Urochloa decumbens]|uniref:C2H2-type domain-containing protein n=1 Tax=Urochloa decumbens TaxID=240449 RepID=A0ABC9DHU7_9POAL
MEFRFRAGGPRPRSPSPARFSSGPSDRRFSPQAGAFHGEPPPPPPPPQPFEWEAAAWRERIIGQEVERRLIEEACLIEAEVHRQLAVARARFHGVFGPLPFVGPSGPLLPLPAPGAFFEPHGPFMPPVPPPRMSVGMQPIPNGPPPASLGDSEVFDGRVGFEQSILVKRRRPLQPPKPKPKPKPKHKIEPSKSSEILSPETKVSGVKRKADVISASTEPTEVQNVISATTEPPELQNAARHRCCELCQVTATTRADLNKHLRGRRHLNKLVQCGDIQVLGDDKSDKGTGPTDVLRTIHILVNGSIHEVVQKSDLTLASTEPIEPQKAISGTTETAELQNVTSATTEPTELQSAARYWSRAICQVRKTSKGKQRKHLSGKKQLKRKLALYGVTDTASGAGPSDTPKKIHILVDGAMHEVVQQGDFVWCECCSVRCINATTMADHLRGKKHSSSKKIWKSIKAVRMKNKRKSQLLHVRER